MANRTPRIRHYIRPNPLTHDIEVAFEFVEGTVEGWWSVEQVLEAAHAAVAAVTARSFDQLIADQYPEHHYNHEDTGP